MNKVKRIKAHAGIPADNGKKAVVEAFIQPKAAAGLIVETRVVLQRNCGQFGGENAIGEKMLPERAQLCGSGEQAAIAAAPNRQVVNVGGLAVFKKTQGGIGGQAVEGVKAGLGHVGGLRLFEDNGTEPVQLKRLKVMELPGGRTHLRFRIEK